MLVRGAGVGRSARTGLADHGGRAVEEVPDRGEIAIPVGVKERIHLLDQRSEHLVLEGDDRRCRFHQDPTSIIRVLGAADVADALEPFERDRQTAAGEADGARELRGGLVVHSNGHEYLTATGSSTVFPGRLQTGDRILGRDTLLQGRRAVGYDSELCTVTFDDNALCQVTLVLPGKGQIEATWLYLDRNALQYGPSHFTGLIDGGTGTFADAKGEFSASLLPNGTLKIAATLT